MSGKGCSLCLWHSLDFLLPFVLRIPLDEYDIKICFKYGKRTHVEKIVTETKVIDWVGKKCQGGENILNLL